MKTIEERFWDKVGDHSDPTVCWLWTAATIGGKDGKLRYGRFRVGDKMMCAHRFSYEMHYHISIPKGMTIDHVKARGCASTLCVNPHHLEVVTMRVNLLRGNTFQSKNANKMYCSKGHLYDAANTGRQSVKTHPLSGRYCRMCRKEAKEVAVEVV